MESPLLSIRLLGALKLRYGDAPLPTLDSARAESLLAYLLLHREAPQSRQHLSFLLWPDSTEGQARTNLRHVLHTLKHALPDADHFLDVTTRTLSWRESAPYWLDVAAFEESLDRTEEDATGEAVANLQAAITLYSGDLLEGSYDEWIVDERERLRARFVDTLARLAALLGARRDFSGAIQCLEDLVRRDPLREDSYCQLMRLYDELGDRARAIRVYHACATTLERELGVEPSAQTRERYEALLPIELQPNAPTPIAQPIGGHPFIGRGPERLQLANIWQKAAGGSAQFVLLTGEPGVGKSRLAEKVRAYCAQRGAVTAEARCYAAEGALAFAPVIEWLRSEASALRLGRLERAHASELARILPEIASAMPTLTPPAGPNEFDQRRRLFEAITHALVTMGAPLVLVAEDLQWCDRETLQFLHYLLRAKPNTRLMLVATARREDFDQLHQLNELLTGLRALDRFVEIGLERLGRTETLTLAEQITGASIDPFDGDRLYADTEGNPLFIVEALRAGWAIGNMERGWMSPKVQAAIEARLATLSEQAREVVGLAATIGREFTTDVIITASESDEATVVRGLDELWRRRIVRDQGVDAYDFSHDKIREVAYLGLGPARRRQAHLRVAETLQRQYVNDLGPVSGQVAAHFEQAGKTNDAITWYSKAADVAQRMYANAEAVRLLDRALELVRTQPDNSARQARELALLVVQAAPLGAVEGYASRRVTSMLERALKLTRALAVEPEPPLLRTLAMAKLSRRDFATARDAGNQLQQRGLRDGDDVLLVEANYVLGIAAFWQGEFVSARRHFELSIAHYHPEHRGEHLVRYVLDPKVICLSRLGNTLWFLGRPVSATQSCEDALALAEQIGHPFSLATAIIFAAILAMDMRENDLLRSYVATLVAGRGEDGTRPTWISTDTFAAYIDVLDGRTEVGINSIRRKLEALGEADDAPGIRAHMVRTLLEACSVTGDARTGLWAADWALAATDNVRLWEAETRRLRARFLSDTGASPDEVEAELNRALHVARRQTAISFELRTATSLVNHHAGRFDLPEARNARDRLAIIVAQYPEGGSSADLADARSALERI